MLQASTTNLYYNFILQAYTINATNLYYKFLLQFYATISY